MQAPKIAKDALWSGLISMPLMVDFPIVSQLITEQIKDADLELHEVLVDPDPLWKLHFDPKATIPRRETVSLESAELE